jgi:Rieske Fe-S protein
MSTNSDKYPTESGRRRFIKGVVGASALGAVGTAGAAAVTTATSSTGAGGGTTQFFGIENTAGPAPRGMPQIPIEIDDNGNIKGRFPKWETKTVAGQEVKVAKMKIAGYEYSARWFQYCGIQTYPGLQADADQKNFFISTDSKYEWQSEKVPPGEKLNVKHFKDYKTWGNDLGKDGIGKPAKATWRSQGEDIEQDIPVQVLRSERIEQLANGDSEYSDWIKASTDKGFIAWMDKCTHFCCVPLFKGYAGSKKFNAVNKVYCPCHQSIYDPFSIVRKTFTALPRPDSG